MYILFVRFISEYLVFFFILPTIYFVWKKDWQMFIKILLAFSLSVVLRKLTSIVWYEPRPFIIDPGRLVYPTTIAASASSFFSGHASSAFSVAGTVFWRYRKFGTALFIMASMVSLGRVLAGLHYPADVFLGALVGLGVSYLVYKLYLPVLKKIKEFQQVDI